jgi:hypothetical protein
MLSKGKYVLVSLGKSACPRASHAGFAKHEEEVCFNFNRRNQIEFAARNSPGKLLPTDRWVGAQTLRLPVDRGNPSSELQGQAYCRTRYLLPLVLLVQAACGIFLQGTVL